MSKIIVFGASGLLGASLAPILQSMGHIALTQGRTNASNLILNPLDPVAVASIFSQEQPDVVVNLIAATNVDECELKPELATLVNAEAVAVISNVILHNRKQNKPAPHLIHISTDQVYDGIGPHTEEKVQPINVYSSSKYAGEIFAGTVDATILRTNFYGKSKCAGRMSFSDWIIQSLKDRAPVTVFSDVKFSAIHINTLCKVIGMCIEKRPVGTFNLGCRDGLSKAEFALSLARELNINADNLKIGTSADVALKARRPLDMTLDVAKLESILNMSCPTMAEEIKHTAKEYLNEWN